MGQTVEAQRVCLSSEETDLLLQMLVTQDVCYQGKARYFHFPRPLSFFRYSLILVGIKYRPIYDRHGIASNECAGTYMLKGVIS